MNHPTTHSSSLLSILGIFLIASLQSTMLVHAFSSSSSVSMFQQKVDMQKRTFTKTDGVEIELPYFQELFSRIQQVSPLARLAIQGGKSGVGGGFAKVDDACMSLSISLPWYLFFCLRAGISILTFFCILIKHPRFVSFIGPENLHWKLIESNKRRTIHKIDRIDNFQQLGCPIVRFRACTFFLSLVPKKKTINMSLFGILLYPHTSFYLLLLFMYSYERSM